MLKQYSAFSLIELLTVIAIVGILASIAVPTYLSYQIRSKIGAAVQRMEQIRNRQSIYFSKHGVFTYASALGLPTTGPNWQIPSSAIPGVDFFVANVLTCPDGTTRGEVGVNFTAASAGLPGPLYFYYLLKEVRGTVIATCYTHAATVTTAVASRPYAPTNCSTLLDLWANTAATCAL